MRSGVPIDVTITRPDVVAVCTAGPCTVNTSATATTTVPTGFTVQLPSVSGSQPLPTGFTAVVNGPGGGSSRQTRRPDLIAGVSPYLNNDRNFLNPAAFAIPAAGTFGNLPRNALKGPGFKQFDLILNKRFRFSETKNLEFRTEIFNILNHANFGPPTNSLTSPLFGRSTQTLANALGSGGISGGFNPLYQIGGPRSIQLALKLQF